MRLNKGKEIMIYEGWANKSRPEGKAQLVKCIASHSFRLAGQRISYQYWQVKFRAIDGYLDPTLHTRRIRV